MTTRQITAKVGSILANSIDLWLFAFLLSLYLLTASGQLLNTDGFSMYETTAALVEDRSLAIDPAVDYPQIVTGWDGRHYSKYDLGQPLVSVPFYWVGLILARILRLDPIPITTFMVSLLPAVATALAAVILYRIGLLLYQSQRRSLVVALLWATGTLAWPYSKVFFSEPLITLCLLVAGWRLLLASSEGKPRDVFLSGLALSAAITVRASSSIYLLAILIFVAVMHLSESGGDWRMALRRSLRWSVLLGAGVLPGVLMVIGHNWLRFHNILYTGYVYPEGFTTPLLVGLSGLLFSPGRSLFLYAPLTLLGLLSMPRLWRVNKALVALILVMLGTALLFFARWWGWHGGWTWGPRYLVPVIPFLLLPIGLGLTSKRYQKLTLAVYGISLLPVMMGVSVSPFDYFFKITQGDLDREALIWFDPRFSPIIGHGKLLLEGRSTYFFFAAHRLRAFGWPAASSAVYIPAVGLVMVYAFVRLIGRAFPGLRERLPHRRSPVPRTDAES